MRRGSVAGPLILIAVGVLFLLRNFIPDLRFTEILGLYWPWLLIGWGSLRVIEILNWHRQGQLTPRGGMSGGEWVLIVFICLFGSGFYAARNANLFRHGGINLPNWDIIGERYDFPLSGVQTAAGKAPRIVVENARGNARIAGADIEEVRVTGTKTIRAITRDDAEKENASTNFEVVKSGDQIIIRTNLERATNLRQASADLEITVPKGASIETRGKYGDFDIENAGGNVDVTSDNAGVRMNNIGGNVRVELRKSDIVRILNAKGTVDIKGRGQDVELENIAGAASINGQYSGELRFRNLAKPFRLDSQNTDIRVERIDGEMELALGRLTGRRLTGPVRIQSKSKDIELSEFTNTVEIDVDRGDIQLRPANAALSKISARTRAGNAELVLPPGAKLDLRAEVKRGNVDNEYGEPFKATESGRAGKVSGSTGGAEVQIDVDRGQIHIRKASLAAPPPPAPPKPPAAPKAALEVTRQ